MQINPEYSKKEKRIFNWLILGCILIILIVVIGGITRLTQSGLSMVKWEPIMGIIPPLSHAEWMEVFGQYQQFPEFKVYNSNFTLSDFKAIFFWEYLHRLIARLIGLVFIIPCLVFWFKGYFNKKRKKQVLLILAFGVLQAALGWVMVKSGLVDNPHVSHYRLAAHLITALGLLAYVFWIALSIKYQVVSAANKTTTWLNKALKGFIVLVVIQLIYGAFVAGLKAGYWYPTFPKMGTQWVPDEFGFMLEEKGISALTTSPGIVQFIHRIIAFLILGFVIYLWLKTRRLQLSRVQKRMQNTLLLITALQFTLGVITVLYSVPVTIGVLHQFGAIILLLSLVSFLFTTIKPHSITNSGYKEEIA
ncbi:MAG: heme A synthase [Crocinitomix sp.]|nr:heme A synthase [Crocinitomix sp.]